MSTIAGWGLGPVVCDAVASFARHTHAEPHNIVEQEVRKSRGIRLGQARRAVRNPVPVKDVAHIGQAVKNFDATHKAYKEAGGTIQDDQEKKLDLLESMPKEIRSQLQWRMNLPEPYVEFRDMLVSTADNICYQDGIKSGGLHAVDSPGPVCEPCGESNPMEESIMAFMKKMGFTGKGAGKGSKGAGKGDRNVAANVRSCINCGSKDHLTAACPKPEVPRDQRPCWKCGKNGHLGRDCRGGAKAIAAVDEHGELILGCLDQDDGATHASAGRASQCPRSSLSETS